MMWFLLLLSLSLLWQYRDFLGGLYAAVNSDVLLRASLSSCCSLTCSALTWWWCNHFGWYFYGYMIANESTRKYRVSHHGSHSIYQWAFKESTKIDCFLITQVTFSSEKKFLSVLHDHVIDSMEGNSIKKTRQKFIRLWVSSWKLDCPFDEVWLRFCTFCYFLHVFLRLFGTYFWWHCLKLMVVPL